MSSKSPERPEGPGDDDWLCVLCRRHPADPKWRPFCSQRCQQLDLARWADGSYRVPGEPVPEGTEDSELKTKKDGVD